MEKTIFNLTAKAEINAEMEKNGFLYKYTCTRSKEAGTFGIVFFNRIDPGTGEVVGKLTRKYDSEEGFKSACQNVERKCPPKSEGKAKDEPKPKKDPTPPVKEEKPKKARKKTQAEKNMAGAGMNVDMIEDMSRSDADPGL
jgi:hypothetical protein